MGEKAKFSCNRPQSHPINTIMTAFNKITLCQKGKAKEPNMNTIIINN